MAIVNVTFDTFFQFSLLSLTQSDAQKRKLLESGLLSYTSR